MSLEKILGIIVGVLLVIFVAAVGYQLAMGSSPVQAIALLPKPIECDRDAVDTYLEDLDRAVEIWHDNIKLADSTSRIALSPVINNLLDQKHYVASLDGPACATYITELAVMMIDSSVEPYLAFMQEQDDEAIYDLFSDAYRVQFVFEAELSTFRDDPVNAYRAANPAAVRRSNLQDTSTWQLDTHALYSFKMPADWESSPDANMYSASINSSDMTGSIALETEPSISKDLSVRASIAVVQRMWDYSNPSGKVEYLQLDDNHAFLVYHDSRTSDLARHISGVVVLPDGSTFAVTFSSKVQGIDAQDEDAIMAVLASLEMF